MEVGKKNGEKEELNKIKKRRAIGRQERKEGEKNRRNDGGKEAEKSGRKDGKKEGLEEGLVCSTLFSTSPVERSDRLNLRCVLC